MTSTGNVSLYTNSNNFTSTLTVNGNVASGNGLSLSTSDDNLSITGNVTDTSGSNTTVSFSDSNDGSSQFNIGGTLSITQNPTKNISLVAGGSGSTLWSNSFFNQNLTFNNISLGSHNNGGTVNVNGNLTSYGNLSLGSGNGQYIYVNGNINSYGGANTSVTLSNVSVTGSTNITQNSTKNLSITSWIGTNTSLNNFLNQNLNFQDINLDLLGANFTLGGNVIGRNISLTDRSSALTIGGNVTASNNLTLAASQGTFNTISNITLTADSAGANTGIFNLSASALAPGITTNNNNITLIGSQINLSNSYATIKAGTGIVTLMPTTAKAINVGDASYSGSSSVFDVSAPELGWITAGTVSIGNPNLASSITLQGSPTVSATSGAGQYNLIFNTAGNYIGTGQTMTLGGKTLSISAGGTVNTGIITGTTGSTNINSGNTLTVDGAVTDGAVTLNSTGTGGITGSSTVTTTGLLTLDSASGNIGSSGTPLSIAAGSLGINALGASNVWVNQSGNLLLNNTYVGGNLNLTLSGSTPVLTVNGAGITTGGNLNLTATGGQIQLDTPSTPSFLAAGGNITLTAGSGTQAIWIQNGGTIVQTGGGGDDDV